MNRSLLRTVVALLACALMGTSVAYAQAPRTWVSGVGDDANPCSRTAPCKTFAGAISKTAPGGEISVLDPGGFGAVTITKSMTLNGDGTLASILVSGTNGIVVNGLNAIVTIRNLSLQSADLTGLNGILLFNGNAVIVENVSISGFDTAIATVAGNPSTGGGSAFVTNSNLTNNRGFGVHALGGAITLENSVLASNGIAAQSDAGATVRLSNNAVYNNQLGFVCGGTVASTGNNRKANNTGSPVVPCTPNAVVTVQ